MKLRVVTIILSVVFYCSIAIAQIRIAVISDTHVMGPGLLVNQGIAWEKLLINNRKLLDFSQEIFCQLVTKFIEQKPDLLLITGDLTKDGEKLSHLFVKENLDELKAIGVKVYVIPGNHDLGRNSDALYFDGNHTSSAETISESDFLELYKDYGYSNTKRDVNSLSYVCEPIPGLVLIGIDSHKGFLSPETLEWICTEAKKANSQHKSVLAMMHHPIFPHINDAEIYVRTATIEEFEKVRDCLANAGISVVLTGHFHTSDIAKDWNNSLSKAIYDVSTGSTVSYPCDYREITLDAEFSELSITTSHVSTLSGQENFHEIAKERLYKGIYDQAYRKAFGVIHDERKCTQLAKIAAEAFILHAEGNEGNKEHETAVMKIKQAIKNFKQENKDNMMLEFILSALEPTIQSVLTDTSNYGDPKRSNKTDDHTLSIRLK